MQISNPFSRSHQRGDTIVEVLIALVIISSVLAGAFVVTSRSRQNVRDTEEHSQALQLLQGQIEQLRANLNDGTTTASSLPSYFCYDTVGGRVTAAGANDFAKCPNDFNGTSGANYQFLISRSSVVAGTTTTYTAIVQWVGLRGQTDTEQILYKI